MGKITTAIKVISACLLLIFAVIIIGAIIKTAEPQKAMSEQKGTISGESKSTPIPEAKRTYAINGTGKDVSNQFHLKKGLATVTIDYKGSSNFIVKLLDTDANQISLLANQIGSWEGVTAIRVPRDGEYLLDITASGDWKIRIEN